jgi:hypothetical protein
MIGATAEGNQFHFMAHELSQIEGIHEIDDAVQDRIEDTTVAPNDGDTQRRSLVYILILNFCHRHVETIPALFDKAFDHLTFVLKGLIAMESKLDSRNSDRHKYLALSS